MNDFVTENNGIRVETMGDLGRVVIATKDFDNLSTVLLREKPAIVWKSSKSLSRHNANFLQTFTGLSAELQTNILSLYHPTINHQSSILIEKLRPKANSLAAMTDRVLNFLLLLVSTLIAIMDTSQWEMVIFTIMNFHTWTKYLKNPRLCSYLDQK